MNFFSMIPYNVLRSDLQDVLSTMDGRLFSFIAASISALFWLSLPALAILPIILTLAILLWRLPGRNSTLLTIKSVSCCFVLGIFWLASVGHWQQTWQLPARDFTQGVWVKGQVKSLIDDENSARFNLKISSIEDRKLIKDVLIRLSWKQPTWPLKQGQLVHLWVKLKPPHGLANQGGFHYQQWLFSQSIVATGYVKANQNNSLVKSDYSVRQRLLDGIVALKLDTTPWIAALSLGHRGLLAPDDWSLVQRTGIAHLIAISGLHLALVGSLCYLLIASVLLFCYRVLIKGQNANFYFISVGITLIATLGYAYLAGFGLPALRAWLMLALTGLLVFSSTHWGFRRILLVGVSAFIVLFPLSLFGQSFWLSFGAVSIIGFVFWRWPVRHQGFSIKTWFASMCRLQLALSLLMLPLVAWQFSFVSVAAPVINLLAVPIVTLVIVPMCLLGVIMMLLSIPYWQDVFTLVDVGLQFLLDKLSLMGSWSGAAFSIQAIPGIVWICFTIAALIFLLPRALISRLLALILCVPLLTYGLNPVKRDWQINVMDVGQGLSVVVLKDNKALVYDVGAAYPSGFNMADSVLLPFLRSNGLREISALVVSHFDNDHSGSLPALRKKMAVKSLFTTKDLCRQNWQLTWQGLSVKALWPDDPSLYSDNNSSCVLRVSNGDFSLLLTGDIDASVEAKLIARYGTALQSNVLIAPHHGSNTSSSMVFIDTVKPDFVVFSQGFMNRWGFPKTAVVERYQQTDAQLYRTSKHGQVQISINDSRAQVSTFRQNIYPYWYANRSID
tara:strand:+ start:2503 stop:4857 length:2355 start_codon:yes stop_codon:yes gene_type:complete